MARWSGFWLAPAAAFAASLETPSMPEHRGELLVEVGDVVADDDLELPRPG